MNRHLFDNEHTVYETVKVGEADGVLGTSTDEHGKNVYTLSWEYQGITHTVMGNIPYDEIMKIETKRMRIALIIQRLLLGAKKRRCINEAVNESKDCSLWFYRCRCSAYNSMWNEI